MERSWRPSCRGEDSSVRRWRASTGRCRSCRPPAVAARLRRPRRRSQPVHTWRSSRSPWGAHRTPVATRLHGCTRSSARRPQAGRRGGRPPDRPRISGYQAPCNRAATPSGQRAWRRAARRQSQDGSSREHGPPPVVCAACAPLAPRRSRDLRPPGRSRPSTAPSARTSRQQQQRQQWAAPSRRSARSPMPGGPSRRSPSVCRLLCVFV